MKLTMSKVQTQVFQGTLHCEGNSLHTKNPSDSSMKKHYGAFVTVGGGSAFTVNTSSLTSCISGIRMSLVIPDRYRS